MQEPCSHYTVLSPGRLCSSGQMPRLYKEPSLKTTLAEPSRLQLGAQCIGELNQERQPSTDPFVDVNTTAENLINKKSHADLHQPISSGHNTTNEATPTVPNSVVFDLICRRISATRCLDARDPCAGREVTT